MSRSLEINNLLLNGSIASLYFPAYSNHIRQTREKDFDQQNEIEREIYRERIHGLLIFTSLKYRQISEITSNTTDKAIEYFKEQIDIVKDFFILNSAPEQMTIEDYDRFLSDINTYYKIRKTYISDLFFDPSFKPIIESNAIKKLFPTSTLEKNNYYPLDSEIIDSINPHSNPYNIDPSLDIAFLASNFSRILGITFFGSHKLIDDIIELFYDYFVKRIPSKEDEIYQTLLCFGVLMKMLKGSGHNIRWRALSEALLKEVHSELAEKFLNNFFMKKQNKIFVDNIDLFNFKQFIQDYYEFLKFAGYVHYGKIHTGVFLAWRALIKYLEDLQKEDEFKKKKGALLENWAFEVAEKYRFAPEKIVLRNIKKPPSDSYYEMKDQIADFKKKPLKFKLPIPDEHNWGPFMEIDVAFKVDDILFTVECKGTSVPMGVEMDIFKWYSNMERNTYKAIIKNMVLGDCIEKNLINHPLFYDITKYIPIILKTEGISSYFEVFSPEVYIDYLKRMREAMDSGNIKEFLKNELIDRGNEEEVEKRLNEIRDNKEKYKDQF